MVWQFLWFACLLPFLLYFFALVECRFPWVGGVSCGCFSLQLCVINCFFVYDSLNMSCTCNTLCSCHFVGIVILSLFVSLYIIHYIYIWETYYFPLTDFILNRLTYQSDIYKDNFLVYTLFSTNHDTNEPIEPCIRQSTREAKNHVYHQR